MDFLFQGSAAGVARHGRASWVLVSMSGLRSVLQIASGDQLPRVWIMFRVSNGIRLRTVSCRGAGSHGRRRQARKSLGGLTRQARLANGVPVLPRSLSKRGTRMRSPEDRSSFRPSSEVVNEESLAVTTRRWNRERLETVGAGCSAT